MLEPVDMLLVEDYEPDARLIGLLLRKNRIANKLHILRDPIEALDFLFGRGAHRQRSPGNPLGAVLLDVHLPKMDGWNLLRQIRENDQTQHLPVIMLSGNLFPDDVERAQQLGANGCLLKPVVFEKLRELLTEAGFGWSFTAPNLLPK
jgi:CheY-like chemotaxis protein